MSGASSRELYTGISRLAAGMKLAISTLFSMLLVIPAYAAVVEYDLTIAQEEVNFTGKTIPGMTINGGIPGPTIRFIEGDTARIRVHNRMTVPTSIHWHGLLVPPEMDGVPFLTFPPIAPGSTFTYEFPIRHSGTFWYHSHSELQEQSGVYGSIVIEPHERRYHPDRDYVVLLSDWTDEDPHDVLRTLKRGSEWYSIEKGSGQSILGAARSGMLGDYFGRELQRMPPMDISDIAYDRFLANGEPEIALDADPGERVRLRIIDGSATTFFYVEFAGGPMTVISADGTDVEPFKTDRLLIGVAETYDVLIDVPHTGSWEFRATAHDATSFSSTWIGRGERHFAPTVPAPNLYHSMSKPTLGRILALTPAASMGMSDRDVEAGLFDKPGMAGMSDMMDMGDKNGHDMHQMKGDEMDDVGMMDEEIGHNMHPMNGDDMNEHESSAPEPTDHGMTDAGEMSNAHPGAYAPFERNGRKYGSAFGFLATDVSSREPLAMAGMDPRRPGPPYDMLRALEPTIFSSELPVRTVRLTLDGDMERYVWTLNNKTLSESNSILVKAGEVVRFIMINRTMMHHPMHLHGHFFRVINAHGERSPLKHTVDVAPMATTVIEFYTGDVGDWFFHCHLLYHMKAGMARVVHYEEFELTPELRAVRPNLKKDNWFFWGEADLLSNMSRGSIVASNTRNILTAEWEAGWEGVDETEWEIIPTWDRYVNRFFSFFIGAELEGHDDQLNSERAVLGLRYLLPLNVHLRGWVDSDFGARISLEKEFMLTPRLELIGEAEYDTHEDWEGRAGLMYTIHKNFSLIGQWHSEYDWGAGARLRF